MMTGDPPSKVFLYIGYALAPISLLIGVLTPFALLLVLISPAGVRLIAHLHLACADVRLGEAVESVNRLLEEREPRLIACPITGREQQEFSSTPDPEHRIAICTKKTGYQEMYVHYFRDCEIMGLPPTRRS